MIDGHSTDGHLTDEELSSHLDGVVESDLDSSGVSSSVRDHLAGCGPCRQRLETLGSVRARLRASVDVVDPEVRAASIEAVMATVMATVDVVPRRRPQVLVGAAAAVLVLAAAVGVPLALVGQSSSSSTRASAPTSPVNRAQAGPAHRVDGSAAPRLSESDTANVSDLGPLSSITRLRSQVVSDTQGEFSTAAPEPQGTQGTAGSLPSASANANPNGEASGSATHAATPAATPAQFERCLSSALNAAGATRTVRLLATATFKGTPALVYVFRPVPDASPTANPSRTAVVATARDGCKVLATTYF